MAVRPTQNQPIPDLEIRFLGFVFRGKYPSPWQFVLLIAFLLLYLISIGWVAYTATIPGLVVALCGARYYTSQKAKP